MVDLQAHLYSALVGNETEVCRWNQSQLFCSPHSCEFPWVRVSPGPGRRSPVGPHSWQSCVSAFPQMLSRRGWLIHFSASQDDFIPLILTYLTFSSEKNICHVTSWLLTVWCSRITDCSQSSVDPHLPHLQLPVFHMKHFLSVCISPPPHHCNKMWKLRDGFWVNGCRNKWFRFAQNVWPGREKKHSGTSKILETTKKTGGYWCHTNEVLKRMQRSYTGEWRSEIWRNTVKGMSHRVTGRCGE